MDGATDLNLSDEDFLKQAPPADVTESTEQEEITSEDPVEESTEETDEIDTEASDETEEATVRSSADTVYRLLPRIWLKSIIDAAKKRHYATQFAYVTELQKGQKEVVIPKRRKYYGSGTEWNGAVAPDGTAAGAVCLGVFLRRGVRGR